MDRQKVVYEKITECMRTIFSFCVSRTSSIQDAEDLSQEIIKELLKSSSSLKEIDAFYGWMWAIANNVYKGYLRNRKKLEHYELDERMEDSFTRTPELEVIKNEELNTLRRELSFLAEYHRKATVMYYIENKSCKHISQELEISLDMVKYLLFKSRKILKEGINMSRNYGDKSYNPGIFNVDVWMDEMDYMIYYNLFERKLPGNILLTVYYNPVTIEEISVELGVSAPYLEDEIKILQKHNLIKQVQNARYQTNIVIFTQSCYEDIYRKTKEMYNLLADKIFNIIKTKEDEIRKINFNSVHHSKNRLYWLATHIALLEGTFDVQEEFMKSKRFPILYNGTHGYIWGTNTDNGNGFFNGIYGDYELEDEGDYISICNFKIIEKCQEFHPRDEKVKILLEAAKNEVKDNKNEEFVNLIEGCYVNNDNGNYSVNFPLLTKTEYEVLVEILEPAINEIKNDLKTIVLEATKVVQNHAPDKLRDICSEISAIKCTIDAVGYVVEEMCSEGYLIVPSSPEKLGMYAVLSDI